jgi:hypothetical protein
VGGVVGIDVIDAGIRKKIADRRIVLVRRREARGDEIPSRVKRPQAQRAAREYRRCPVDVARRLARALADEDGMSGAIGPFAGVADVIEQDQRFTPAGVLKADAARITAIGAGHDAPGAVGAQGRIVHGEQRCEARKRQAGNRISHVAGPFVAMPHC